MRCTVTNPEQSITDFLKDPHYSAFLVPSVYSTVHRQALTAAGFKTSWQATTSGHLHFRALRVHIGRRGPERLNNLRTALTALFGETERLETIEGRIRDQILPIVVPTDVSVAIDRPKAEKSEDEKRERKAITAYLPLLTRLAQISGRAFVFHASRKQTMQPHPEDGHVHIYTNACPPGESDFWYIDTAFGLEIAAGSKERPIGFGPTEGRGQVLVEEDEKTLVQILADNWYFLIPTLSYFNTLTSAAIFERLLALAWNAVFTGTTQPTKSLSKSQFLKEARGWTEGYTWYLDRQIKQMEEDIEALLRRLAGLHREISIYRGVREGIQSASFSRQTRRRLPGELEQIKNHPLIEGIELFKDGIHVRTIPLTTSHEGIEYLTGVFTIRINKRGAVTVWSEGSTHPDGVPHPHIAKHGGPCFGNAGTAISRAGGEARYADAITYVLTWLTVGYSQELAENKIQEWPTVPLKEAPDAT